MFPYAAFKGNGFCGSRHWLAGNLFPFLFGTHLAGNIEVIAEQEIIRLHNILFWERTSKANSSMYAPKYFCDIPSNALPANDSLGRVSPLVLFYVAYKLKVVSHFGIEVVRADIEDVLEL